MRSSPVPLLPQLISLSKPIRLHLCQRCSETLKSRFLHFTPSANVSTAASNVKAHQNSAAGSGESSFHQMNLRGKNMGFRSVPITCLFKPPRKLTFCICTDSARAVSTKTALSAQEDSNGIGSKNRKSSIWDASYAVKDESTGSDIFVEFSVDSVRQMLRKKATTDDDAYRLNEFREEREGAGESDSIKEKNNALSSSARRRRKIRSDGFEALPDEQLAALIPDELDIHQLLYVLGRASVLANQGKSSITLSHSSASDPPLLPPHAWTALFENLRSRIDQMQPLELTRASQALAYCMQAVNKAALDSDKAPSSESWKAAQDACKAAFEQLQRTTATRIHELHGDCLSRVFYASVKGEFPENAGFVEFACAEVVGRLDTLRPYHVFRIFQSSQHSKIFISSDFIQTLARHLVNRLAYLPAESISALIPSFVQLGIFSSSSHLAKLNIIAGKRFRGLSDFRLLVRLGEPLLLHNLLTPVNIVALLKGLMRTETPTEYPNDENHAKTHLENIHEANKYLLPLKLMEICIRHENPEVYKTLSPRIRSFLEKIRNTQIKLTCFAPPLEQQHVNASLLNVLADKYHLSLSLYGPFLLELSDPLSRVVVEWDSPWLLYPTWKQFKQQVYAQQKHRYLRAEGWKVILLPLQEYLNQNDEKNKEKCLVEIAGKLLPECLRRK